MKFVCPICNNANKDYLFELNGKLYCRKCNGYKKDQANSEYKVKGGKYKLEYDLTSNQKQASFFVLQNVKEKINCSVNAVCGAGKTEIIYETLEYCLNNNLKIGIAIPRKDVVIELKERIKKDFNVSVTAVYGGSKEQVEADLVIFTTHQAYRYINYFDVLIIDEVDAFPYNNNKVLREIISKCSNLFIYLSATMPKEIERNKTINKFYLNKRYHGYDLPIPKCLETFRMLHSLKNLLKKYKDKIVLVYFPTIKIQRKINKKIKCDYLINSKSSNRENILKKIKSMSSGVIFTTTILERGITIPNVQVIVYQADHKLFNKDTLIQIEGRVGRSKSYPKGDIYFICKTKNKEIKRAIKSLKKCNE